MGKKFDPYHVWLGIPPQEQPPNGYRMLGLRLFESDPDVICNAADQRMAHVRAAQTGEHAAEAERILNEMSRARGLLLDPEEKSGYDAHLRKEAATAAPSQTTRPAPHVSGPLPMAMPSSAPADASPAKAAAKPPPRKQSSSGLPIVLLLVFAMGGGALLFLLAVGGLAGWWLLSNSSGEVAHNPEATATERFEPVPLPVEEPQLPADVPAEPSPVNPPNTPEVVVPPVQPPDELPERPVEPQPKPEPKPQPKPPTRIDPPAEERSRLPIPSQAEQKPVLTQLAELYPPEDFKTNDERANLARELLRMGIDDAVASAERFVLLRRASEFAAQGGEPAVMSQAVARLAEEFELDAVTVEAALLGRMAQQGTYRGNQQAYVDHVVEFADDAVVSRRFGEARQVLLAVLALPTSQVAASVRDDLQRSLRSVNEQRTLYSAVDEATRAIEIDDADADAHWVLARWYCFTQGDWETGLVHLAKSTNVHLQSAAAGELAGDTASALGRLAVGNLWWEAAPHVDEELQAVVYARAAHWYRQVNIASLKGLDRVALEKRMSEYNERFSEADAPAISSESVDRYVALFAKAVSAAQERRFGDADRYFSYCLRINPNSSEAIANYALSGLRLGHSQRAVKQWQRLIDAGVDAPELLQNMKRCRMLISAGEIRLDDNSIADLDKLIRTASEQSATYGRYSSQKGFLYTVVSDTGRQAPWEDRGCFVCDGDGRMDCPVRGCSNGKVRVPRTTVVATNPITGQPITNTTTVSVPCQHCRAKGDVDCNKCTSGKDRRLP